MAALAQDINVSVLGTPVYAPLTVNVADIYYQGAVGFCDTGGGSQWGPAAGGPATARGAGGWCGAARATTWWCSSASRLLAFCNIESRQTSVVGLIVFHTGCREGINHVEVVRLNREVQERVAIGRFRIRIRAAIQ